MLQNLQNIIIEAAEAELLPRFRQIERFHKADGSVVTEADYAIQHRITAELQNQWPDIPLLGEEMDEADQNRLMQNSDAKLWVLDPLDGTSNFAAGIPCFAVSIALIANQKVELAVIYDPLRKECFSAVAGEGAMLNGEQLLASENTLPLSQCIAQIDFKRLPSTLAASIASKPPFSSQRNFGSGVLDWCWLAAGRSQLYLHGKQKLWDYCAGQLILQEAGGRCCTLDGDEVFRGKLESRSVVAAANAELFNAWREVILTQVSEFNVMKEAIVTG